MTHDTIGLSGVLAMWILGKPYNPLQKRESTGASFLYWLHWKSKHFNWNFNEWKAPEPILRVFSGKLSKWDTNRYNSVACLANLYKLSILGVIWTANILPFSSSKYLADLSFEYVLFPSSLTSPQWPFDHIVRGAMAASCNFTCSFLGGCLSDICWAAGTVRNRLPLLLGSPVLWASDEKIFVNANWMGALK